MDAESSGVTYVAVPNFRNLGAQLRTLSGGEAAGYTKLLTASRNEARVRMWSEARARGANAIVGMRFDCNEIGDIMSEVVAYGDRGNCVARARRDNTLH